MAKTILSEQYKLQTRDFIRGAVLAVLASIVPIFQESLKVGKFDWQYIGIVSGSAFLAYIMRAFFEPTKVIDTNPSEIKVQNLKNSKL